MRRTLLELCTDAALVVVLVFSVVMVFVTSCAAAKAQWGTGGCPPTLPVWQPGPVFTPAPITAPAPGGGKLVMTSTPYADVVRRVAAGERVVMLVRPPAGISFPVRLGWTTLRSDDAPLGPGRYDCERIGGRPMMVAGERFGCDRPGCECRPCECRPCECRAAPALVGQQAPIPGGIDWSKCPAPTRDYYDVNGRVSTYEQARRQFYGEDLADDSSKPWLIFKGIDRTDADLAGALKSVAERCRVIAQPADSEALDYLTGSGVWLVAPGGRELLHLERYDSAEDLAAQCRVKLDLYDPLKDPGPGQPYPWPVVAPTPPPSEPPADEPSADPTPAPHDHGDGWQLACGCCLVCLILYYLARK